MSHITQYFIALQQSRPLTMHKHCGINVPHILFVFGSGIWGVSQFDCKGIENVNTQYKVDAVT